MRMDLLSDLVIATYTQRRWF